MNAFVVVGNLQRFDIVDYFKSNKTVIWKQVSKCETGDRVFIYVGRPLSRLVYECRITKKDVSIEGIHYLLPYAGKRKQPHMELELIRELPVEGLSLKTLLDKGLKTVQCSTRIDDELKKYIDKVIK